jgi:hypothetical protein
MYGCVLPSLFVPLSLCYFYPCVPLPVIFLSLSYTVWYSYRCVPLPLYLYLCVPLPPLLLSLCFFASLLTYPSYTASGTPILVFHRISTYTCVFYCVCCSYPRVPSPLYLTSLCSTASFLLFLCSIASSTFISCCTLSATRLHVLNFLCYSYFCVLSRVLRLSLYSIAFATRIREGLCLPHTCTCVVLTQHALSVTHITCFIFVCIAVVIGVIFV